MHLKSIYEELASLYLRLNGFLQHINYVIETANGIAKEVDIIAYRPAGAIEVDDSGKELELDNSLFNNILKKLNIKNSPNINTLIKNYSIAAIASVKSLYDEPWSENKENLKRKIDYALNILGLSEKVKSCVLIKKGIHVVNNDKTIILLLGFSQSENSENTISWRKSNTCYLRITHKAALEFILKRIELHEEKKRRGIQYYPSPLFSTLILLNKLKYKIQPSDTTTPQPTPTP